MRPGSRSDDYHHDDNNYHHDDYHHNDYHRGGVRDVRLPVPDAG